MVPTKLLQVLHGFYTGSAVPKVPTRLLENGFQNKKLNFLVFCCNTGLPFPTRQPIIHASHEHDVEWKSFMNTDKTTDTHASAEPDATQVHNVSGQQNKKLNFSVVHKVLPARTKRKCSMCRVAQTSHGTGHNNKKCLFERVNSPRSVTS